jgi:hypothetical protein
MQHATHWKQTVGALSLNRGLHVVAPYGLTL